MNRRPDTIVLIDVCRFGFRARLRCASGSGSSRRILAEHAPRASQPADGHLRAGDPRTRISDRHSAGSHGFLQPMSEAAETSAAQIAEVLNRALAGRRLPAPRVAAECLKGGVGLIASLATAMMALSAAGAILCAFLKETARWVALACVALVFATTAGWHFRFRRLADEVCGRPALAARYGFGTGIRRRHRSPVRW